MALTPSPLGGLPGLNLGGSPEQALLGLTAALPGLTGGLGSTTLGLMMPAGGLTGGPLLGAPAPGTNKFNPLQGQTAVTGIGAFVNQLMTTNTLRKLGILPRAGGAAPAGGGAAANPLSGLLGGLLGGGAGGGDPLSALLPLLGSLGGTLGAPPAAPAAAPAAPAADFSLPPGGILA